VGDYYSYLGDSGGAVVSFVSPQALNLVILHGIHSNGGGGISACQLADTIFKELAYDFTRIDLRDLTLYLGDS
ncbi:29909_t:CDS:1, partial [Racocetra persica]